MGSEARYYGTPQGYGPSAQRRTVRGFACAAYGEDSGSELMEEDGVRENFRFERAVARKIPTQRGVRCIYCAKRMRSSALDRRQGRNGCGQSDRKTFQS